MTQVPGGFVGRATDAVTAGGYRLGWRAVRMLPERVAYQLFERAADTMTRRNGRSVQRMRDNYAIVWPELGPAELDELVARGVRSYLRYWCEAFRLPELTAEDLTRAVRVEGSESVREALAAGRSVIAFLGHLGNWDMAGAWATKHLGPVVTVAERLKPEEVFEEFLAFREDLGMTIIPLTGGGKVFDQLLEHAQGANIIPLLADRDLTHTGLEVDFAGDRSRVAVGPAALALDTGSTLHPVSITYERHADGPGGWRTVVTFHPAVEPRQGLSRRDAIEAMTQECATALGEVVRERTEDWHMMQRVFVRHLDAARLGKAPTQGAS